MFAPLARIVGACLRLVIDIGDAGHLDEHFPRLIQAPDGIRLPRFGLLSAASRRERCKQIVQTRAVSTAGTQELSRFCGCVTWRYLEGARSLAVTS